MSKTHYMLFLFSLHSNPIRRIDVLSSILQMGKEAQLQFQGVESTKLVD